MATLESVAVHITPGRMTVGYYTVEDGELRMLGPDGEIAKVHVLRPDDNVKALAGIFTKEIRNRLVNPFWDDMSLPEIGIA